MLKVVKMGEIGDLVVRDVEDAELVVVVEARYLSKKVMGYIEFFQVGKIRQTGDFGKSVRLNRQNFKAVEGTNVLLLDQRTYANV